MLTAALLTVAANLLVLSATCIVAGVESRRRRQSSVTEWHASSAAREPGRAEEATEMRPASGSGIVCIAARSRSASALVLAAPAARYPSHTRIMVAR